MTTNVNTKKNLYLHNKSEILILGRKKNPLMCYLRHT